MQTIVDYGQISNGIKLDDGSYRVYARVAVADYKMPYLNYDGTERYEYITKDDLFNIDSLNSIKNVTITNLHPPEAVTPDNYSKYAAGTGGSLIALDGNFLGMVAELKSRDIINAYEAGVRGWSPGYKRDLVNTDSKGVYRQVNRKYNHNSLVPDPRGGSEVITKDAGDKITQDSKNSDIIVFNYAKLDKEMLAWWERPVESEILDALLHNGKLNRDCINLDNYGNNTMPTVNIKIGDKSLLVDSTSVNDAIEINKQLEKVLEKGLLTDSLTTKVTELETEVTILKSEKDKLVADSKDINIEELVADNLKQLASCKKESEMFGKYIDVKAANLCLDAGDIKGYKTHIVKANSPNFDAVKEVNQLDVRYKTICDAASSKLFPNINMEQIKSAGSTSIESVIAGKQKITMSGLPSDANWS